MSTLIVRLPPAASTAEQEKLACAYAWVSAQGLIERRGACSLTSLADEIRQPRHVILLLAACDVMLLRANVPQLPSARLSAALPFLVEEHLLCDPASCLIAAGPQENGTRMLAITQKAALDSVVRALQGLQFRSLRIVPSQLCLPAQDSIATAAARKHGTLLELGMRLSTQAAPALALALGEQEDAAHAGCAALRALQPKGHIALRVPAEDIATWEMAAASDGDIDIVADEWESWRAGISDCRVDFAGTIGAGTAGIRIPWRSWRLPLALAAATLALNVAAINVDWWQLSKQATQLRETMRTDYRRAYPGDTVIVDPLAQARQHNQASRRRASPEDFLILLDKFSAAWEKLDMRNKNTAIASIEYRPGVLLIRLGADGDSMTAGESWKQALESQQLSAVAASAGTWRISAKGD